MANDVKENPGRNIQVKQFVHIFFKAIQDNSDKMLVKNA